MSFLEFEDYGIYRLGSTAAKSVPKQRTAADDWSRLSEKDRADVRLLREVADADAYEPLVTAVAFTYIRRHG